MAFVQHPRCKHKDQGTRTWVALMRSWWPSGIMAVVQTAEVSPKGRAKAPSKSRAKRTMKITRTTLETTRLRPRLGRFQGFTLSPACGSSGLKAHCQMGQGRPGQGYVDSAACHGQLHSDGNPGHQAGPVGQGKALDHAHRRKRHSVKVDCLGTKCPMACKFPTVLLPGLACLPENASQRRSQEVETPSRTLSGAAWQKET